MAEVTYEIKQYPSDLTDQEWERIKPLLPKPPKRGRKPAVDLREILNAIRYMARSAGGWRMLPTEFGPWQTVYWWFRRFVRLLLFRTIHDLALMMDRERAGREASPSARWERGMTSATCSIIDRSWRSRSISTARRHFGPRQIFLGKNRCGCLRFRSLASHRLSRCYRPGRFGEAFRRSGVAGSLRISRSSKASRTHQLIG